MIRILDHDGPRREVAEPFALPICEQHDQADAVPVGEEIDDPNDVADPRLRERERLATITHRAQSESFLADGLAGPERFAHPEVAKDHNEAADHRDQRGGARTDDRRGESDEVDGDQDAGDDEKIQDLCDGASPKSCDLVVKRDSLRRGDDKFAVRQRLHVR